MCLITQIDFPGEILIILMNTVRKKRHVAGSTLKRKRRALGLSISEAAALLCTAESTYRSWENNGAGEEAVQFASGEWDNTIKALSGCSPTPFLECAGKIHSVLSEDNQGLITAALDQLASRTLSELIQKLNL